MLLVNLFTINLLTQGKQTLDEFKTSVHYSFNENCESYLKTLQISLELAIEKGDVDPYNNQQITNWLIDNSDILNMENHLDNFVVSEIGYIFITSRQKLNEIISAYEISDVDTKIFIDQYIKYLNDESNITDSIMEDMSQQILENTVAIDKVTIIDILNKCITDDTNTLFSVNNNNIDLVQKNISNKHIFVEPEDIWIHNVIVPHGSLGFYNEPGIINGGMNLKYKKIAISMTVKEKEVMKPYYKHMSSFNKISNISLLLLTVIAVASVLVITVIFKNTLKFNTGGGSDADETNRDYSRNNSFNHSSNNKGDE